VLPARQWAYAEEVARRLGGILGDELLAAYVIGSGALGDWIAGRSDIDVLAIAEHPLAAGGHEAVVAAVGHRALPCPARALELVVYARAAVAAPRRGAAFELNLNTGATIADHVSADPAAEAAHWFVLDLAAAREHARPLAGPPARELIGPVPEPELRRALLDAVRWHAAHEPAGANTVLNACRAWRRMTAGDWVTKGQAGRWAIEQGADLPLLTSALALHEGAAGELDHAAVAAFLGDVAARLGATPAA
jgi:hypothetical protein